METFFKGQYAKIAWHRVAVIVFGWTVFAMQGKGLKPHLQLSAGALDTVERVSVCWL